MGQPLEVHIRKLQEFYWSEADPEGRGFVPLADALRKAGEFLEAHRVLRDGLRRHPGFLAGHVVSAWLSLDEGQLAEAESHFRAALELDPRNVAALRGLSEIHLQRGEEGQALEFLELLLEEDPIDANLPERLKELKARADDEAASGGGMGVVSRPTLWEDPDEVAEELDLQEATLQPDSSPPPPAQEPGEVPADSPPLTLVVEDGEPIPEAGDLEDALITSTLGEIYLRQGLLGRAEWVFESLLEEDPENPHLRRRLDEVQGLLVTQATKPADERPVEEWVPEEIPVEEEEPLPPLDGLPETLHIVPIESLAPDRVDPGQPLVVEELPRLETVPVGDMAFLAPHEVISIDALAPHDFISIDALAPHDFISIDDLVPDEPVPIHALAPQGPVPIESLAPDEPGAGDSTVQDFERWLDKL